MSDHDKKFLMLHVLICSMFHVLICSTTVLAVESAIKYSFVYNGMQARLKGRCRAELTLLPNCLCSVCQTADNRRDSCCLA